MYPSRVIGYQDHLFFKAFFPHPYVGLSSFINLVAKVQIFIKLTMHVLSHGCLLSSYKTFSHLHTWFCLSCDFNSSGCKCLFIVYAFFSWEASCYESCLVSHNVSIYYKMELQTSLQVLMLHLGHHSSWIGTLLPFLLGRFCINDVVAFIILFFILNCRYLFFWTSLILLFL